MFIFLGKNVGLAAAEPAGLVPTPLILPAIVPRSRHGAGYETKSVLVPLKRYMTCMYLISTLIRLLQAITVCMALLST